MNMIFAKQSYRIGEVLEDLIQNPDLVFEHIADQYRFTVSYNKLTQDYNFIGYCKGVEIEGFAIDDIMCTDMEWMVKTDLLYFDEAFKISVNENKMIKHKDMFSPCNWQEFFWDYSKEEIKRMVSEKAWEAF